MISILFSPSSIYSSTQNETVQVHNSSGIREAVFLEGQNILQENNTTMSDDPMLPVPDHAALLERRKISVGDMELNGFLPGWM